MKKVLVAISIALGTLTGCVGYAGDGYGRYGDRYYDGGGYYGSGYRSGYRNVDYDRRNRYERQRRYEAQRRDWNERREERRDWNRGRDHDRSWSRRGSDPSGFRHNRSEGMRSADKFLERARNAQSR